MSLHQPALELAILGRLMLGPSHGYELRKHVSEVLGYRHSVSFGSLYPALRRMSQRGLICDCANGATRLVPGRSRRTYHLTSEGQERLASELSVVEPETWADDDFGVRFSLFGITAPANRLRVLRGRRDHTRQRLATISAGLGHGPDRYTNELVQYAHDSVVRELDWLDRVIAAEETCAGEEVLSGVHPTKENQK